MPQTLLGSVAIAYQSQWSRARDRVGVRLHLVPVLDGQLDAPHLLQTLRSFWPHRNATLLLAPGTPELLLQLLDYAPDYSPAIEVAHDWLADGTIAAQVMRAHERGVHLVWRGPNDQMPAPVLAPCFRRQLLGMSAAETLAALCVARPLAQGELRAAELPATPVQANALYEGIASRELADYCLDHAAAAALCGWPLDEMLHAYRHAPPHPAAQALQALIRAASADASLEVLENILGQDPVLAYRFLVHVNSAANGLRSGIPTLRRGLMMMGISALKAWALQLMPHANTDHNLQPVRADLVLRAQLTEHLLDAGGEADLRREIYLSSLFAPLDMWLNEPLAQILERLPLPERVPEALVLGVGDYVPYLTLARAMQGMDASALPELVAGYDMNFDDVNRALLRTLAVTPVRLG